MVQRPEIASLTPGSFANLTRWDTNGILVASYIHGREVKR
jgi:hypothetical protein